MFWPFEMKHNLASIPLKLMWQLSFGPKGFDREKMGPMSEVAEMFLWAGAMGFTVSVNAYPAIKLIDMGIHGPWQTVAVTYKWIAAEQRHSLLPTFHTYRHPSPAYRAGFKFGGKFGGRATQRFVGRLATRTVPILGWSMLAYDVYDVFVNRSLWGFDFESPGQIEWGADPLLFQV